MGRFTQKMICRCAHFFGQETPAVYAISSYAKSKTYNVSLILQTVHQLLGKDS